MYKYIYKYVHTRTVQVYKCTLYITVVLGQYIIWTSGNGNAVLCNYIDFDVIFQKIVQYKFYNTLIPGRTENKNFASRSWPEISARLTSLIYMYLQMFVY